MCRLLYLSVFRYMCCDFLCSSSSFLGVVILGYNVGCFLFFSELWSRLWWVVLRSVPFVMCVVYYICQFVVVKCVLYYICRFVIWCLTLLLDFEVVKVGFRGWFLGRGDDWLPFSCFWVVKVKVIGWFVTGWLLAVNLGVVICVAYFICRFFVMRDVPCQFADLGAGARGPWPPPPAIFPPLRGPIHTTFLAMLKPSPGI